MTTPDSHGDDDLRSAFDDAVSGVEPVDRLGAIQARTARTTRSARTARRGWYVGGGAVLAAAAVVVAVAVTTTGGDGVRLDVAGPGPTGTPTPGGPVEPPAATTPVYYVGPGSTLRDMFSSPRLYRYFEPEGDPLELLMSTPSDPDYRTLWPQGSLQRYSVTDSAIVVTAAAEPTGDADLARQQLVYTMQAALGSERPVELSMTSGGVVGAVIPRADPIDVLSHVNISDPGERYAYAGSFTARGTGTGFEGTVACRLTGEDGVEAWSGAAVAGTQDEFAEWELEVDLTGVVTGDYELACSTEDPSDVDEGSADTYRDDRTIYVEDRGPVGG